MAPNRSLYALYAAFVFFALCIPACASRATIKDDSSKTPTSCECKDAKDGNGSKSDEPDTDYGDYVPKLRKNYQPDGPDHRPFGG